MKEAKYDEKFDITEGGTLTIGPLRIELIDRTAEATFYVRCDKARKGRLRGTVTGCAVVNCDDFHTQIEF